jgi:diguanylate cyclase (GGDEF)-like protein
VKIADFGIARMIHSTEATQDEAIFGTPSFMSPEQMQGKPIDARSDIFSLGVVLYYMLSNRLPFPAEGTAKLKEQLATLEPEKPSSLNPGIPAALETVIYKCLAKDPDARYKNANDLANDLRSCLSALQHAHTGAEQPIKGKDRFKRLRRVVSPRRFSQKIVALGNYFAMFVMVVITIIDLVTPDTIQMNLLYLFPLIVISLHSERKRVIAVATVLALLLQGIHLVLDDIPVSSKIALAIMIVVSDIVIVLLARIARLNFIEVEQLSSFDSLTGLRNRLSFEVITDIEIDRHKRNKAPFSFAYIDLHQLKELNQTSGYAAGDKAIKLVARVIRENMRQLDTPSRIGGDKFAILMPNTNAAECESFCKQLAMKISNAVEDASLPISTNIGYASFEDPPASVSEIFDTGENAMHRAKASGRSFAVCA